MNKGNFTVGFGVMWATITTLVSLTGVYFSNQGAITERVNETAAIINKDISKDRERIASLEEAVKTIKDTNLETRNDVKEILKLLK